MTEEEYFNYCISDDVNMMMMRCKNNRMQRPCIDEIECVCVWGLDCIRKYKYKMLSFNWV